MMRRTLRDALFLARRDLAQTLRQRETLLWTFVMPVVFFYFIGTVTGGFADPAGSAEAPDLLVLRTPADAGFLVDELRTRLEAENYRVLPPDSVPEGATPARELFVPALPADSGSFTAAVLGGRPRTVTLRRGEDGLSANFDRVRVARAVYGVLADLAVLKAGPAAGVAAGTDGVAEDTSGTASDAAGASAAADGITHADFRRLAAMPRPLTLRVESAGRREEIPTGFAQAIPGTMVMFTMLVLLTSGAITLVVERERGLLRRLAATPISRTSVVLGKWASRLALGVVQIAFAMAAGTLLFSMDWGSAFGAVALVLLAWAAFNASLAMWLAGVARTEAQASGIGVLATLVLAALGGAWWPIEITPEWMQSLALALPTGWTMDAMHRLVNFGYGMPSVTWHVVVLTAATVLVTWAAGRAFRYR